MHAPQGGTRPGPKLGAGLALMAASGFAALGCQIVWTQQAALWLGHETPAVLAVVAAFFGGLALGAFVLAPRIERSARPARGYALCEAMIGLWTLVLALALGPLAGLLLDLTGAAPSPLRQWSLAFGGLFLLLLPATAAMGATLPAMERALGAAGGAARWPVLYAANTAGAVLGALGTAFLLVPALGLVRAATLCAAANLLCAALAWRWHVPAAPTHVPDAPAGPQRQRQLLALLAATGLLGIGYEVLVVRVLSQVAQNTVYTFAILLAVYLLGSAAGAAAYASRRAAPGDDRDLGPAGHDATRDRLLASLAGAVVLGAVVLSFGSPLMAGLARVLGPGLAPALVAEAALAALAFGPATLLMGALFSHLAQQARAAGASYGAVLGWNTLGAAAAAPLVGVLLVPALGTQAVVLLLGAGYLLLLRPRSTAAAWAAGPAIAGLVWVLTGPGLVIVDRPPGSQLVWYDEGAQGAVSVVEDDAGLAVLRIDNRQQEGSNAAWTADARQAVLPLLLHPAPRRVLFMGLGTGVTARAAAADPALEVRAVELLPGVVAASHLFIGEDQGAADRLQVTVADARRFMRTDTGRHDVIVSDNFHPARRGSASLYTVEHFSAVRERLAPGGLFCQWLPLHQMDRATLAAIVSAFTEVYPDGGALLATLSLDTPVLGLVARAGGTGFDPADVRRRLAEAGPALNAGPLGLHDEWAVLGQLVAGPQALAALARGAPRNTDDHPVVAYLAPRLTYAPDSTPRERLFGLLAETRLEHGELGLAAPATSERLAAYRRARDAFLLAGRDVRPTADPRAMLAQVRQPLLAVLRLSPDFRPAREPLRRLAQAVAPQDPATAEALLADLAALGPPH
jgi:spermidine synthase